MTGGRERDRYGRKDWREHVSDIPAGIRAHPIVATVAAVMVGGLAILLLLRPTFVTVLEVAAGDCLYIRAETSVDDTPGPDPSIGAFAERAGCGASHSHEVLWVRDLGVYETPYPDGGALAEPQDECDRTLEARIGDREPEGLTATLVPPSPTAWAAGARAGVCTVHRADGGFLDRPLDELVARAPSGA